MTPLKVAALAACALTLGGCGTSGLASVGGGDGTNNTASVLGNLQGCYRRYTGSIAAGFGAGASGSFNIVCDPKGTGDPTEPRPARSE
jgi:hypothetical protein